MASSSSHHKAQVLVHTDEQSAGQREFYTNVLDSLIKSFPGPREEAIAKAIAYLEHPDDSRLLDSSINAESRNTNLPTYSCPAQQQSGQALNKKSHFGGESTEQLSRNKKL